MSMTREQLLNYLDTPELLNEKTLLELREILDEFPYFQTAHLLYTRNLLNVNNFRFDNQLKICAIHATDRTVLYHLLNHAQKGKKETELPGEVPIVNILLKSKVADTVTEQPRTNVIFDQMEPSYRLDGVETESGKSLSQLVNEINEAGGKSKKDKSIEMKGDLIDRFLKENPAVSKSDSNPHKNIYTHEDQDDEINANDEFITETLARIYIKQGLYQKAINAFQKLTLKYPEKSVYFARQIEEVTNLLNK
jgi:hypothetical protein